MLSVSRHWNQWKHPTNVLAIDKRRWIATQNEMITANLNAFRYDSIKQRRERWKNGMRGILNSWSYKWVSTLHNCSLDINITKSN